MRCWIHALSRRLLLGMRLDSKKIINKETPILSKVNNKSILCSTTTFLGASFDDGRNGDGVRTR